MWFKHSLGLTPMRWMDFTFKMAMMQQLDQQVQNVVEDGQQPQHERCNPLEETTESCAFPANRSRQSNCRADSSPCQHSICVCALLLQLLCWRGGGPFYGCAPWRRKRVGGKGVTVSLEAAIRAPAPSARGPTTAALSGHVLAGRRNIALR